MVLGSLRALGLPPPEGFEIIRDEFDRLKAYGKRSWASPGSSRARWSSSYHAGKQYEAASKRLAAR